MFSFRFLSVVRCHSNRSPPAPSTVSGDGDSQVLHPTNMAVAARDGRCYGRGMDGSSRLSAAQLTMLAQVVTREGKYLTRLVWRMERLNWAKDDPLYARAMRARDGVMSLLDGINEAKERAQQPSWMRARGG